jgi:hypothetical protein
MKTVVYEENGKLHRVILRDDDPEDLANEGIPLDPPSIEDILENAKTTLHNELVQRGLFDVKSLNENNGALSSAVNKCITREIIKKYLREEKS